jgi:hypothetical protein
VPLNILRKSDSCHLGMNKPRMERIKRIQFV